MRIELSCTYSNKFKHRFSSSHRPLLLLLLLLSIQICCIVTSVLVCRLRPFISLVLSLTLRLLPSFWDPSHWLQEDASDSEHLLNNEGPLFVRDRITSILQCLAIFYMQRSMQASGSNRKFFSRDVDCRSQNIKLLVEHRLHWVCIFTKE